MARAVEIRVRTVWASEGRTVLELENDEEVMQMSPNDRIVDHSSLESRAVDVITVRWLSREER